MKKKTTRVVSVTKADNNNVVATVVGGDFRYVKRPCEECPFKTESPIGAFPAEAYRISAHTAYDMATETFACHMAGKENPATCAGFLSVCHHNMSVRIHAMRGDLKDFDHNHGIQLFESYREMAEENGVDQEDRILERCR